MNSEVKAFIGWLDTLPEQDQARFIKEVSDELNAVSAEAGGTEGKFIESDPVADIKSKKAYFLQLFSPGVTQDQEIEELIRSIWIRWLRRV